MKRFCEKFVIERIILLGESKKTERTKIFDLSKLQIFINKSFTTSLNAAVNHSSWQLFFEAKELSHIKSENEMTGQDVYTFSEGSNHP